MPHAKRVQCSLLQRPSSRGCQGCMGQLRKRRTRTMMMYGGGDKGGGGEECTLPLSCYAMQAATATTTTTVRATQRQRRRQQQWSAQRQLRRDAERGAAACLAAALRASDHLLDGLDSTLHPAHRAHASSALTDSMYTGGGSLVRSGGTVLQGEQVVLLIERINTLSLSCTF